MKSYINDIVVTDKNGEKAILYPNTKQEAIEGLRERLENVEKPDITETTETTMPNSRDGRFLFKKIKGVGEQGENPSPENPQEVISSVVSKIKSHGKNFIPYPYFETTKTQSDITFTDLGDGRIKVNGTSTNIVSFELLSEPIKLDANKRYTITGSPQGSAGSTNYAILAKGLKPDGTISNLWVGEDGLTFSGYEEITVQDGLLFRIRIAKGVTVNNLIFEPMLRLAEDSDATWEPYKESVVTLSQPIELDGYENVKDEIINENGIFKVVRKRGKHRLTSAEKGTFGYVSTEGERRFHLKTSGDDWISSESNALGELCTHAIFNNQTNVGNHGYFYLTPVYCIFTDNDHYWADLDAFKSWLDSNEVYIEYNLKTPIVEELPLADQIALNSIETFDGITCLEFDSEIKPEFEGEYGTSKVGGIALEALLVARNNDIRISSVEATVVNNI